MGRPGKLTLAVVAALAVAGCDKDSPLLAPLRSSTPPAAPPIDAGTKYDGKTVREWFAAWPTLRNYHEVMAALAEAPDWEVLPPATTALATPGLRWRDQLIDLVVQRRQLDAARAGALVALLRDADQRVARAAAAGLMRLTGQWPPSGIWVPAGNDSGPDKRPKYGFSLAFLEAKEAAAKRSLTARFATPGSSGRKGRRAGVSAWPGAPTAAQRAANRAALAGHLVPLGAALSSKRSRVRDYVLELLESYGAAGVAALSKALGPASTARRVDVLAELRERPALVKALAPAIARLFTDSDVAVRRAACSLIEHSGTGDAAVARALATMLVSGTPGEAYQAGTALRAIPEAAAEVLEPLRTALSSGHDPAPRVTAGVLESMGSAAAPLLPDVVVAAQRHKDPRTRAACFRALGAIGVWDKAVHDVFAHGVEDPAPEPCVEAVKAMGEFGRPAVPLLSWCLRHPRPAVAELATWELYDIGLAAKGAAPDLQAGLFHVLENPKAFWSAMRLLLVFGVDRNRLAPYVEARLASDTNYTRRGAVEFAADLGPAASTLLDAILARVRDVSPQVRRVAGWSLVRIAPEDPRVHEAVRRLLIDPDGDVRVGAYVALHDLGDLGLPLLTDLLDGDMLDRAERVNRGLGALHAVRDMDEKAVLKELQRLLRDHGPRVESPRALQLKGWIERMRYG